MVSRVAISSTQTISHEKAPLLPRLHQHRKRKMHQRRKTMTITRSVHQPICGPKTKACKRSDGRLQAQPQRQP